MHAGSERLGDAGLVAFTPCGHWWVYPIRADAAQLHRLARFNLGLACSFCLADWQRASNACESGTTRRLN